MQFQVSPVAAGAVMPSVCPRIAAIDSRMSSPHYRSNGFGPWSESRVEGGSRYPVSACVEMFSDVALSTMFAIEAAAVAHAETERQREFATVRHCARTALGKIGLPGIPILPDADGVPRWPRGVVGSLTHCAGYRAAIVSRSSDVRGIGIDAEPHDPLPVEVRTFILRDEELQQWSELRQTRPDRNWERIFFCAKEAAYKVWFPLTRRWLDFPDLVVGLSADGGFEAQVLRPEAACGDSDLTRLRGRWEVRGDLVVATSWVDRVRKREARRDDRGGENRAETFESGGEA
jgi:4'-phosphopantetheinyl transferase EntD